MNNKTLGTLFEREICEILANNGYWVHFLSPDHRGAQPFDIIAVKDGIALAADCKTCESATFSINRLEDNQKFAFEKWMACGNLNPVLFVKHDEKIYLVTYLELKSCGRVKLDEGYRWGESKN